MQNGIKELRVVPEGGLYSRAGSVTGFTVIPPSFNDVKYNLIYDFMSKLYFVSIFHFLKACNSKTRHVRPCVGKAPLGRKLMPKQSISQKN